MRIPCSFQPVDVKIRTGYFMQLLLLRCLELYYAERFRRITITPAMISPKAAAPILTAVLRSIGFSPLLKNSLMI